MITSLLDSSRSARNALVVGCAWIAVAWLLAPKIETAHWNSNVWDRAVYLSATIGHSGRLIVVGFGAWLVGELYLTGVDQLRLRAGRLYLTRNKAPSLSRNQRWREGPLFIVRPFSRVSHYRLFQHVLGLEKSNSSENDVIRLAQSMCIDAMYLGPRLLDLSKDLHEQYDRWQSEADLRDGLCIQILIAGLGVVIGMPGAGAFRWVAGPGLIILSLVWFLDGRRLTRRMYSLKAHLVADGRLRMDIVSDRGGSLNATAGDYRVDLRVATNEPGAPPPNR